MSQAIVYTRFSPRRNASESESCDTQEAQCAGHAAQLGIEVKSMHRDEGVSGKAIYKPGLEDAINALEKGDVLLVYSRCRLARDLHVALHTEKRVAKAGATIVAVTGDAVEGDSDIAVLIRQIMGAMHEYERKLIAARTKAAMKIKLLAGRKVSRFVHYGFRSDPTRPGHTLKIPAEQRAIVRVLELADEEGISHYGIARRMDSDMPGTSRGAKWNPTCVRKIIERAASA